MSPLIQCQHVDFGYDNQDAVTDVNMEVDPGDLLDMLLQVEGVIKIDSIMD